MRYKLRRLIESDLPALQQALCDTLPSDEAWFYGLGKANVDATQWLKWRQQIRQEGFALAGFTGDQQLIGEVALQKIGAKGSFSLSYWVRHSFRGRGLATAICKAFLLDAISTRNIRSIELNIHHDNIASRGVALRLRARLRNSSYMHLDYQDAPQLIETYVLYPHQLVRFDV